MSTRVGLRATAQAVKAVATAPTTPTATGARVRGNDFSTPPGVGVRNWALCVGLSQPASNRHYRRPLAKSARPWSLTRKRHSEDARP